MQLLTSKCEVTTTTSASKKKEKKEHLSKAQKRRFISRTGSRFVHLLGIHTLTFFAHFHQLLSVQIQNQGHTDTMAAFGIATDSWEAVSFMAVIFDQSVGRVCEIERRTAQRSSGTFSGAVASHSFPVKEQLWNRAAGPRRANTPLHFIPFLFRFLEPCVDLLQILQNSPNFAHRSELV